MKGWREKMAREAIRAREKAELAALRLELQHAKERKRALMRAARAACSHAKGTLRAKLKARREAERERLRLEAQAARRSERSTCKARSAAARRRGALELQLAEEALRAARTGQRLQALQASRKVKTTHVERRQESDEEAARDLPHELQRAWLSMAKRFRGTPRMSRAEQFMHWAHENPGEVAELHAADADREVERLIREHSKQQRRHGLRKTRAEVAAELQRAGVPF